MKYCTNAESNRHLPSYHRRKGNRTDTFAGPRRICCRSSSRGKSRKGAVLLQVGAIVLNACLVTGQMNKKEALRIAFDHSPFFRDTQLNVQFGPGRSLLVQQCETWSTELGFASLSEAQERLLKYTEDQKESFDNNFTREPKQSENKAGLWQQ